MTGRNSITFNPATMIQIVQHYLDTVMLREPHTQQVVAVSQAYDTKAFTVELDPLVEQVMKA